MRCYQGKPETNAGKSFNKLDVKAMGCISNPEVTHSLLTILIVLLVALMFILLYFNRRKVQDNVKPLIDNFQRSMQYKTIEKVSVVQSYMGSSAKKRHLIGLSVTIFFYYSRSMKIWERVVYL